MGTVTAKGFISWIQKSTLGNSRFSALAVVFVMLFASISSYATDQRYLNYSGRIVNAQGVAVSGNVQFHI
jgi:hypothetical protein